MAHITGIQIIDAPGSALNNAGAASGTTMENAVATKFLRVGRKQYPYVSAQAYRRWLRETVERLYPDEWERAPIYREAKVAYTDANPIRYSDDDLFGYMRAPGKKVEAAESRATMVGATPVEAKVTITRVSPFRVGTLVGMTDGITSDFGTMSRHEGDAVPHEHQFYKTALKGLFSLDLSTVGSFSYLNQTGHLNLDKERRKLCEEENLENDEPNKAFRLPIETRQNRVGMLLRAVPHVSGGAKLGLHYTDVSPVIVIAAAFKGANNPFQYSIQAMENGEITPALDSLREAGEVWGDQTLSPVFIGWTTGYCEEGRLKLKSNLEKLQSSFPYGLELCHPRHAFERLADLVDKNPDWFN